MSDLRTRFGAVLAIALLPILIFSFFMVFSYGSPSYIVVSIFAWAFAYMAIWIATDRLVFLPLRKIKKASDQFASGNLKARVGDLENAPDRISELGAAFDRMADNIVEREERLVDNLREKETMLREIHHRVKNNLQIITSLLNMQERKLKDPYSLELLRQTRGRINAIALVHRGLYEGDDLGVIDMRVFLSRLLSELKTGLGVDPNKVQVKMEIEKLYLEPDTAIPTALFIVEALTNSIKHGLQVEAHILIELRSMNDRVKLSIIDDGPGVEKGTKQKTGKKLMKGFARQLSGVFSAENTEEGYQVSLSFNLPENTRSLTQDPL